MYTYCHIFKTVDRGDHGVHVHDFYDFYLNRAALRFPDYQSSLFY